MFTPTKKTNVGLEEFYKNKHRSETRNNQEPVIMNQTHQQNLSPSRVLKEKSVIWNQPVDSIEFARRLDREDPLSSFRSLFSFPKKHEVPHVDRQYLSNKKRSSTITRTDDLTTDDENESGNNSEDCLYLCGQSLGLKPKSIRRYVDDVLDTWGSKGVHSHFNGQLPAALADMPPKQPMARMVGASPSEVALMNGLTVNLHLLLCTFYRPTARRHKIIIEEHAFSSDMYVVKSQIKLHGLCPDSSLVLLKPRTGESLIREEDAIRVIEDHGDSTAVILIPGIQYYTGQKFNIPVLTQVAHSKGIVVGCDLAHAVGNVPLYLHDWNVDFAAWCTYKYLNAGAGCIGGIFVHDKWTANHNASNQDFPMLRGWWGNVPSTKFSMKDEYEPASGADMFKLSNPPAILCAMLMASLDIFSQTNMEDISKKQFLLTGYLEYLLKLHFQQSNCLNSIRDDVSNDGLPTVEILTPSDPKQRGSQLSICFSIPLACVQEELKKRGVVCDVRKPCVLRVAPAPLYNSFQDVYKFVHALKDVCYDLSRRDDLNEGASLDEELAMSTTDDDAGSTSSRDFIHSSNSSLSTSIIDDKECSDGDSGCKNMSS